MPTELPDLNVLLALVDPMQVHHEVATTWFSADRRSMTTDQSDLLQMLTYVEKGTEFTREYGDINEAFYNSLESVLEEAAQILKAPSAASLNFEFSNRLDDLKTDASHIGWGYGDSVREIVDKLAVACIADSDT